MPVEAADPQLVELVSRGLAGPVVRALTQRRCPALTQTSTLMTKPRQIRADRQINSTSPSEYLPKLVAPQGERCPVAQCGPLDTTDREAGNFRAFLGARRGELVMPINTHVGPRASASDLNARPVPVASPHA